MSVAANDTDDWETCEVVPVVAVHPKAVMTRSSSSANANATAVDGDDMDAPTSSFRNLRLVPPPSAQDGGAFDRVDPFQRQQQPSPQHALFDPNGNYTQPVSMATATAAVAQFGPLDPVLLAALENSRERLSLLKFEDQIVRFIKNPREMQLNFPPLSSYHRLIIHRLAERCCLEHQTADFYSTAYTQGYDSNAARVVTLFKTAQTIIPRVLLIDLSAEKQQPAVTPASAPKIMVRKRNATRGNGNGVGGHGGGAQDAKNQQRSIEDRERAYAEARARIFGEASSNGATTDTASASASASSTGTGATGVDKSITVAVVASVAAAPKLGTSHQAAGPDGSRGFGRGNGGGGGRGNGGPSGINAASSHQQQRDAAGRSIRTAPSASRPTVAASAAAVSTGSGASVGDSVKSQQNWKESKVLWRNREQELNDPDFTRNHDAYRPSRDQQQQQQYGGGRFANGGGQFYDGPRSYGYQSAAQPPFPGRGRGPPPPPPPPSSNEYSRIDPMQRSMQHGAPPPPPPPPPPPADYYRHPSQIHPPPPSSGGFHTSYSPHGRGGYAPPSSQQQQQQQQQYHHHHHQQQQPLRRGSAGGGGGGGAPVGGYNEAFPPLGK